MKSRCPILVVEDDPVSYIYLSEILTPEGYHLINARDGKEAIDKITEFQHELALVLLDIRLPILDGFSVIKKVREMGIMTPVIAQTAYAMESDRLMSLEYGCNDYIAKPISRTELLEKVQTLISCNK